MSKKNIKQIQSVLDNKYKVIKVLAEGGMGKIYLGKHHTLGKPVAVKIIHKQFRKDEETRKRFFREARIAANLNHPGIIDIYDYGVTKNFDYIIMPYVSGVDLKQLLEKKGAFGLHECLKIGCKMAEALSYAHEREVIHRDIKPANIMIDRRDNVVLTDFGISKEMSDSDYTKPGMLLGTLRYISPEQIDGKNVDQRSDIYSFGLVLYEMITGEHPFQGTSDVAIMYKQIKEKPMPPSEKITSIPEVFSSIIMKCIEKDPDQRYQDCAELLKDLNILTKGSTQSVSLNTIVSSIFNKQDSDDSQDDLLMTIINDDLKNHGNIPKRLYVGFAVLCIIGFSIVYVYYFHFNAVSNFFQSFIEQPVGPSEKFDQGKPASGVSGHEIAAQNGKTKSTLTIESTPDEAEVFLDGRLRGNTPLEIPVNFGVYKLKISKNAYYEWEVDLKVDKIGEIPLNVRLIPEN